MKKFRVILMGLAAVMIFSACSSIDGSKTTEGGTVSSKTNASDVSNSESSETEKLNDGNMAKEFEMLDIEGNTVKLSDFKGEKVYISYWATWCGICSVELEELNKLVQEDIDFKIITMVAPGARGELDEQGVKDWIAAKEGIENVTIILDDGGKYMASQNVRAFPTSAYIGTDGVLVGNLVGFLDNDGIKENMKLVK